MRRIKLAVVGSIKVSMFLVMLTIVIGVYVFRQDSGYNLSVYEYASKALIFVIVVTSITFLTSMLSKRT